MILAQMISPQALSHPHTATKVSLPTVKMARAVVADAVVAAVEVAVEWAAMHSLALRR